MLFSTLALLFFTLLFHNTASLKENRKNPPVEWSQAPIHRGDSLPIMGLNRLSVTAGFSYIQIIPVYNFERH